MSKDPSEFPDAEDYFPYIGHDFDREKFTGTALWQNVIGTLFAPSNVTDRGDSVTVQGRIRGSFLRKGLLFRRLDVEGLEPHRKIAQDPNAVEALVPRHRSLYDYSIGMPVHHELVNPETMVLAGDNLFVSKFDDELRYFGGFMFVRQDAVLSNKGLPQVPLSAKRYLDEVYPAYLKQQMFDGEGPQKKRKDMILYAGQEKDPRTKKRSGGRTKTGKLRNLSPLFFDKFKQLVRESSTKLYVAPVNVSFSKYPDAPFITHPIEKQGIVKTMRYVAEQSFIMKSYPHYAMTHPNAQLHVVVRYGPPQLFTGDGLDSIRDMIAYAHTIKEQIGRMETIFPTTFIYRALNRSLSLTANQLSERAKVLYDYWGETGIDVTRVSGRPGEMMPIRELIDASVRTLNRNPGLYIWGVRHDHFISFSRGRIRSHDRRLQSWYANNIRHLDPPQ